MMGLPCGEEIMIVGRTMWTQCTSVTDRRTDGRTDRRTELRSQTPCNAERRTVKKLRKLILCQNFVKFRQNVEILAER